MSGGSRDDEILYATYSQADIDGKKSWMNFFKLTQFLSYLREIIEIFWRFFFRLGVHYIFA